MIFIFSFMVSRLLCILWFYNLSERVTEDLFIGIIKLFFLIDKYRYMFKLVYLKFSIFMNFILLYW